jgi:hypothetical protein
MNIRINCFVSPKCRLEITSVQLDKSPDLCSVMNKENVMYFTLDFVAIFTSTLARGSGVVRHSSVMLERPKKNTVPDGVLENSEFACQSASVP